MEEYEVNTILIVDDEPMNLDFLEIVLDDMDNFVSVRAQNGMDALKSVASQPIDLIILDLSMPGMDGLEVLERLKHDEKTKYIPVVVVTAKSEEHYKALEIGAEDFLTKPIDILELKFRMNNLLKLKKYNDLQRNFNERLEEEIRKKEEQLTRYAKVQKELSLARDIQQSLLPRRFPDDDMLQIFGSCVQASEVGGDFFDVFETPCRRYTVAVMADVSGHGFASAMIAMQFRTLVHTVLFNGALTLSESVERINNIFSEDNKESSMFITALFLRFDRRTEMMESVNAGHFDPIGHPEMVHQSGLPLGIQGGLSYTALFTEFTKGSAIFIYTDGIVEGENEAGEMYGKRIYDIFKKTLSLSPEQQVRAIENNFEAFVSQRLDDVTLLVIRRK